MKNNPHKNRICDELNITLRNLNKFIRMVNTYADAWVFDNNNGGDFTKPDKLCDDATLFAKKLGIAVDWSPGLYPVVSKGGKEYHLQF